MKQPDTIIIGAGASGLIAAMHLTRAGKQVLVLEARYRVGGRIHTFTGDGFNQPVELGAEFVHGNLSVTLNLLTEAGIKYQTAVGDMWRYEGGKFVKPEEFLANYELIINHLNDLTENMTLNEFLETYFSGDSIDQTRNMLINFAAGYDTADPANFSAFAMRRELQSEDSDHQYRLEGGYAGMTAYLEKEIIKSGGKISLLTVVKELIWKPGNVTVVTEDDLRFYAAKVVIAIPLGVLQAGKQERGAIMFNPPIHAKEQALQKMGMGAVIKISLQFDHVFWEAEALKKGADPDIKNMSYLFTDEAIPTWWTQTPNETPVLTGWLGGPSALKLIEASADHILELALRSISNIYGLPLADLKLKLTAHKVMNWPADPFARGSYSYATLNTDTARTLLCEPEADTIYFAGEALYDGPEMGTVEAALASGTDVAHLILGQ